jgi:hypothetical protein
MLEMRTLNGYEVVDAKAREAITNINTCNTYFFDPNTYEWSDDAIHKPNYAPDNLAEFATRLVAGEGVNLQVGYKIDEDDTRWMPAEVCVVSDAEVQFTRMYSIYDYGRETDYIAYTLYFYKDAWRITERIRHTKFMPDKNYVDNAIKNAIDALRAELTGGN